MKSDETTEKITVRLPHSVYHTLRNQAYQQNISLPEFIQRKIDLKPGREPQQKADASSLAALPLREILAKTKPIGFHPDERLDFFHG